MSVYTIPTSTTQPHYSLRVDLDAVTYVLTFHWNARDASWYLDIADEDEVAIVCGVKVSIGVPLAIRSANPAIPAGMLIAVDTSGANSPPGFADLGDRVLLYYFDAESAFGAE